MVSVNDVYGGSYLNAEMLRGKKLLRKTLKIIDAELLTFERENKPDEHKIGVTFEQTDLKLILNKTSAKTLQKKFGDNTDDWIEHNIQLMIVPTSKGDSVQVDPDFEEEEDEVTLTPNPSSKSDIKEIKKLCSEYQDIGLAAEKLNIAGFDVNAGGIYDELVNMEATKDISKKELTLYKQILGV